jgi:hypothetical protein
MKNIHKIRNELYITSDEQPKHNDYYTTDGKEIYYCNTLNPTRNNHYKKIILTTDQDLIADGVQAIDDEFLEWFVKNPSCERVEVEKQMLCDYCGQEHCDNLRCRGYKDSVWYEIIIPQEEPCSFCEGTGQVVSSTTISGFKTCDCINIPQEEPKQETIEEVAANLADPNLCKTDNWIAGANWQAERMYSEEEVLKLVDGAFRMYASSHRHDAKEWLVEQFKKK